MESALATAAEQVRLAKEENTQLRERLDSLETEINGLRDGTSPGSSEGDTIVRGSETELGLNLQHLQFWC